MSNQNRISNANFIPFFEKIARFSYVLLIPIIILLFTSLILLYSAGGGSLYPYFISQSYKILLSLIIFLIVSFTNIKFIIKSAYILYIIVLILIITTTFVGHTGMGATRWLNFGILNIQPSEFIKITLVLVLTRYFSWMNFNEINDIKNYIIPATLILIPLFFIVLQPDLGTALSIIFISVSIFYSVGLHKKWFIYGFSLFLIVAPITWFYGLYDYQKNRIITFINPNKDLKGTGYQTNQSKITLGSGGFSGKGYLKGTQIQQEFLPEKHTDFIFTILGEEFGFLGCLLLMIIYITIILILYKYSKLCKNRFGQLFIVGFILNFFTYYFINIAMVLGLIPTVGVPLPLISFGGSSLISLMFGFGICENIYINKDQQLSSKGN